MKLTLTEDDGTVVDQWDSHDELDVEVFLALLLHGDVAKVTADKVDEAIDEVGVIISEREDGTPHTF